LVGTGTSSPQEPHPSWVSRASLFGPQHSREPYNVVDGIGVYAAYDGRVTKVNIGGAMKHAIIANPDNI